MGSISKVACSVDPHLKTLQFVPGNETADSTTWQQILSETLYILVCTKSKAVYLKFTFLISIYKL